MIMDKTQCSDTI